MTAERGPEHAVPAGELMQRSQNCGQLLTGSCVLPVHEEGRCAGVTRVVRWAQAWPPAQQHVLVQASKQWTSQNEHVLFESTKSLSKSSEKGRFMCHLGVSRTTHLPVTAI